jgi:transposase
LTLRANELQAELGRRVARVCPRLLSLPGCGVLTAAKILAEVAGVGRFRSEAALAMHAGAAPLECSSGAWQRHGLSRVDNRQLNAALHRIAVTQLRVHPPPKRIWRVTRRQASPSARRCGSSSGASFAWSSTCCTPISTRHNSTRPPLCCPLTNQPLDLVVRR